jgi:hypothetical protein
MIRTYKIESLDEKKALKLAYDDKKQDIKFRIGKKNEVDIDKAIKLLSIIGSENAIEWIYKLEIVKMVGWDKIETLSFLNDIKEHLSIESIKRKIILMYKNKLKIAEFKLPIPVKNVICWDIYEDVNIIKNKNEVIEFLNKAIKKEQVYYFFEPRTKTTKDENAFMLNFEVIDGIELKGSFFGESNKELNKSLELQVVDMFMKVAIENMPKDGKIILQFCPDCKDILMHAAKYKDLFNRQSIKNFFEILIKTSDLAYAIFDTDIKYEDLEFITINFVDDKYAELYHKYYLTNAIEQLNNNQFYGFKFKDNEIIDVFDLKYLEPLLYII